VLLKAFHGGNLGEFSFPRERRENITIINKIVKIVVKKTVLFFIIYISPFFLTKALGIIIIDYA